MQRFRSKLHDVAVNAFSILIRIALYATGVAGGVLPRESILSVSSSGSRSMQQRLRRAQRE